MKPQTCCCHICKTSLNQYKREFLPCTACNKIVCKNCFGTKFKGPSWEESNEDRAAWLCPSCCGTCSCPRCRKKPRLGATPDDFKPNSDDEPVIRIHIEKLKPKVEKLVLAQLQDMIEREKRCESVIKEMERLLMIMRREKEDICEERQQLEALTNEVNHHEGYDDHNLYSGRESSHDFDVDVDMDMTESYFDKLPYQEMLIPTNQV